MGGCADRGQNLFDIFAVADHQGHRRDRIPPSIKWEFLLPLFRSKINLTLLSQLDPKHRSLL
jgi:hypothetical protein